MYKKLSLAKVQRLMIKKGLTVNEFAKEHDYGLSYVRSVITGSVNNPKIRSMISALLEIPENEIFGYLVDGERKSIHEDHTGCSVMLDNKLNEILIDLAERKQISKSELIRRSLNNYFAVNKNG